jgi:opacity protein-like surface antigen
MKKTLIIFLLLGISTVFAQDNLDSLLNSMETPKQKEYVKGAFKGTRVINLHSLEKVAPGALQFIIQHRFGPINGGAYQLYGLDQATIRFGLEYGLNKYVMIGIGRSSFQKTYDAFAKISLLRQAKGDKASPISVLYFSSITANTTRWEDTSRTNYFTSRLCYTHQLIIGSKVNDNFSFEIVPTLVHKNLVTSMNDKNDFLAVAAGIRYKLTRRTSVNVEYIYRIPPKDKELGTFSNYYNSLSVGFDIETGGHVFQFHFTNSLPMIEKGFITETTESWLDGGIHLGFNISRDFVLRRK